MNVVQSDNSHNFITSLKLEGINYMHQHNYMTVWSALTQTVKRRVTIGEHKNALTLLSLVRSVDWLTDHPNA